jgi:hypothetical protein
MQIVPEGRKKLTGGVTTGSQRHRKLRPERARQAFIEAKTLKLAFSRPFRAHVSRGLDSGGCTTGSFPWSLRDRKETPLPIVNAPS